MRLTESQISDLIREIRLGRQEDSTIDWKLKWWDLAVPESIDEFRKDICALANSSPSDGGLILLGVSPSSTHNAPPPRDESALQQILGSIEPPPRVHLETINIDGAELSLLYVDPPFDRPYVSKYRGRRSVFVRRGSSTDTATRFDLDSLYSRRKRLPALSVGWIIWEDLFAKEAPRQVPILEVPAPLATGYSVDAAEFDLTTEVKEIESEASRNGLMQDQAFVEDLSRFRSECEAFLEALRDETVFDHWLVSDYLYLDGRWFTVVLTNSGSAVATSAKAVVEFPDWVRLLDRDDGPPSGYVSPPTRPDLAGHLKRLNDPLSAMRDQLAGSLGMSLPHAPWHGLPAIRSDWTRVDSRSNRAVFEIERLTHRHNFQFDQCRIVAAPGKVHVGDEAVATVQVFCEEQPDWIHGGELRLVARQVADKRRRISRKPVPPRFR
jgi:hypothetical protein